MWILLYVWCDFWCIDDIFVLRIYIFALIMILLYLQPSKQSLIDGVDWVDESWEEQSSETDSAVVSIGLIFSETVTFWAASFFHIQ